MKVTMIRNTYHAADLVGQAAALCTNSDDWDRARRGAMASGHMSVAEHASYTFLIEGVSRTLLAQITRHRIASFSVQSQRYCGVQMEFVTPETFEDGQWRPEYSEHMERSFDLYKRMVASGVPEEDARYVIPQSVCCSLIMTMNARELDHFFSLRCCNRAQWEIRELADRMLEQCREIEPELFRKAGPGCVRGKCPEGKMSCGRPRGNG
jgi:thymidylate synthase (FAD)